MVRQLLMNELKKCRSMAELGRKIGIKQGTIRTYISGDAHPEMDNLTKIARYFGISIEELQGDVGEQKNGKSYTDCLNTLRSLPKKELVSAIKVLLDEALLSP